jgi:hypothetical protein
LSEKREPYVTCVKRADASGHPLDPIAEEVHNAWMDESARHGRVAQGTTKCPKCGRELEELTGYDSPKGIKHLHCRYCVGYYSEHPGMVPYEELLESEKDYRRATAGAALKAIEKKEVKDQMNEELFTLLSAIADQCGGKLTVMEKHLNRQGTTGLSVRKDKATGNLEINLYEG